MNSESIGFIGIGNVGSNLANNLLKSNNNVFVYDKNKKSYSRLKKLKNKPCKTLDELVEKSNIIITCLPSSIAVKNVLETLLKYLTKNGSFVCKFFRNSLEKTILQNIKQRFSLVKIYKPDSSRKDSKEIYLIAIGFNNLHKD